MMRKYWRLLLPILMVAALFFIACGKKGDPLPPARAVPSAVAELKAQRVQGGVILRWNLSDRGNEVHRVRILRREFAPKDIDCSGCREEMKILLDLYADDPRLVREATGGVHYLDSTTVPERTYVYRIVLCNVSGYCSDASQEATPGEVTTKDE